eukprot:3218328-Pyramimonas_sp.AAC.1
MLTNAKQQQATPSNAKQDQLLTAFVCMLLCQYCIAYNRVDSVIRDAGEWLVHCEPIQNRYQGGLHMIE